MKPYFASIVSSETIDLFHQIEKIVQKMPDIELEHGKNKEKELISCHMVCRALARFYPIDFKDGYFGGYIEHSWLLPRSEDSIIDPYPIGCLGGPILLDLRFSTPWRSLYKEGRVKTIENALFQRNVSRVIEAVQQTKQKLGL